MTTSTTKHTPSTPGPWNDEHVTIIYYAPRKTDSQECLIIGNNLDATENDWIALVPHSTDEDKANARLIAAAPELLSALVDLLDACPTSCEDRRLNEAQRAAERVVAKVNGGD